jgi:hypothetical protein
LSIEAHYWSIRSVVRELGHRDSLHVIWAYSQYLQVNGFKFPNDIEASDEFLSARPPQTILAEWTLELMAREIIRYAEKESRRGRTLRHWRNVAKIANALRDLEGDIYAQLVGGARIHLELMRIAHRQIVWQQHRINWKPIIRYFKLFNTPEIQHCAQRATGLSLKQIYLIGLTYLGIFLEQSKIERRPDIQIPGLTQEHIDRFLAFTSLGQRQLAVRLRSEHALDEGFFYRYSSLREFPLVQISHQGRDEVLCPIPTLLFWRITTGLYYTLKDMPGFPNAFGGSFQRYVGEVLHQRITNPRMTVLSDVEYHDRRHRKDTVDWIIQQGDESALFIECKAMRLTWASKAGVADLSALENDIRKLASAVVQVYKTIRDYRAGLYPNLHFVAARQIYPVVVTLEDWYFFGREMPFRLDEAIRTEIEMTGLPAAWLEEMPYCVMSVDEFEKAAGVLNSVGIQALIAGKVRDSEYRHWGFAAYCRHCYPEEVRNLPKLFFDEYKIVFADAI